MIRKTLAIFSLICLMISFWAWLVCYDTQSRRLRLHYSDPQTGQPRWLVGLTAEKGYLSLDYLNCGAASVTKFMFDGRWRTVLWRPRDHVTLMWSRDLIFTMTTPGVQVSNYYYAFPRLSSRGGSTRLYIPLYLLMTLSVVIFAWVFGVPFARRLWREREGRCVNCGYDMRVSAESCPECAAAYDPRTSRWHRLFTLKTATYTSLVVLIMSSGCWGVSYTNVRWGRPKIDACLKFGCFQWLYFKQPRTDLIDAGLSVGGFESFGTAWFPLRLDSPDPTKGSRSAPRSSFLSNGSDMQLVLPMWPITTLSLIIVTVSFSVAFRQRQRKKLGLCLKCGYDLRGSKDTCPECGTEFESSGI